MCSRTHLVTAETYQDIHANSHIARSNETLKSDFAEKERRKVTHVNAVERQSIFEDFPFFQIPLQLPQCSSHDYLEVK